MEDNKHKAIRWQNRDGNVYVLCLNNDNSNRDLNMYNFEKQFNPNYQFLVSRKYRRLPLFLGGFFF